MSDNIEKQMKKDIDDIKSDLEELISMKKEMLKKYDSYTRYKIPFLSNKERSNLGKIKISDKAFNGAFESSLKTYKEQLISPGIPIMLTSEMITCEEEIVGYVIGKEDNNAIVICEYKDNDVTPLFTAFDLFGPGSSANKEKAMRFYTVCKNIADGSDKITRLGICAYIENGDALGFIHHFRLRVSFNTLIE